MGRTEVVLMDNVKKYLNQLQKIDIMIKQRQQERDELRDMLGSIGSFDYSKDRVQTSPSGDAQYAKTVERIADIEAEVSNLITDYASRKNIVISQIQALEDPKYVKILYKRYVEFKMLRKIASEMGYTYQYIILLHGNALKDFGEKIEIL